MTKSPRSFYEKNEFHEKGADENVRGQYQQLS